MEMRSGSFLLVPDNFCCTWAWFGQRGYDRQIWGKKDGNKNFLRYFFCFLVSFSFFSISMGSCFVWFRVRGPWNVIIKNIMISFLFFLYIWPAFLLLYREYGVVITNSCLCLTIVVVVASEDDLYNLNWPFRKESSSTHAWYIIDQWQVEPWNILSICFVVFAQGVPFWRIYKHRTWCTRYQQ